MSMNGSKQQYCHHEALSSFHGTNMGDLGINVRRLFHHWQNDIATIRGIMVNTYGCFLEITIITLINIYKFLGVSIGKWEPAALNLYHDAVSFLESMRNIRKIEFHPFYFIRLKCFGRRKTVTKPPSHDLTTHQHLIASHRVWTAGIATSIDTCSIRIFKIIGENINHLHNKISVSS